jgi:apolipoprotein N-acyltransferase
VPDAWFDKYRWGWCALAGILLVLSFAPFACATCGWIALVPAWWVLTRSRRVRRQPIRHGYLIGLIYFGGTFWWISNVTVVGAVFLILYVSFYPGIWLMLMARLVPRNWPSIFQALAGASLWVLLEWWRSWFLTGFDWDELGASQAPSVIFRQLAAYGGVPLISFVLVFVNILWAEGLLGMVETFRKTRTVRASLPFAAALLVVAIAFALGWHHLLRHRGEGMRPTLNFACIQPNVPQVVSNNESWQDDALKREVRMSQEAMKAKPDLLIWPEAIIDEGIFQDRPLNEAVHSISADFGGYFLLGSQDFDIEARKLYNCAYLFAPYGDDYQYYQKTRLVVWGEYLPFGDTFPWFRRWAGMGMDFTAGRAPKKFVLENRKLSFAPLICFEDTLADVPAKAARLGPDFFVTITNDGWYTGWFAAWGVRQHLNLAVFRCVEHDRPMIRCANNGISCEIDQDGTVIDRLRSPGSGAYIDVAGIFSRKLEFYSAHGTFYERWGNWIILLSELVGVMLTIRFFVTCFFRYRES